MIAGFTFEALTGIDRSAVDIAGEVQGRAPVG